MRQLRLEYRGNTSGLPPGTGSLNSEPWPFLCPFFNRSLFGQEISNEMWEILPKYQATLRLPCYSDGWALRVEKITSPLSSDRTRKIPFSLGRFPPKLLNTKAGPIFLPGSLNLG